MSNGEICDICNEFIIFDKCNIFMICTDKVCQVCLDKPPIFDSYRGKEQHLILPPVICNLPEDDSDEEDDDEEEYDGSVYIKKDGTTCFGCRTAGNPKCICEDEEDDEDIVYCDNCEDKVDCKNSNIYCLINKGTPTLCSPEQLTICGDCFYRYKDDFKRENYDCDDFSDICEEDKEYMEFWDEAVNMFGYKITKGHPMYEAFELFKEKKKELEDKEDGTED